MEILPSNEKCRVPLGPDFITGNKNQIEILVAWEAMGNLVLDQIVIGH